MNAITVVLLGYMAHLMIACTFIGYCLGRMVERRKRATPTREVP